MSAPEDMFRVRVTLLDTEPPVWRELEVRGDLTLDRLHTVLQRAMGWTDSHLHRFYDGEDLATYFLTDLDIEEGEEGTPEAEVQVAQALREPGDVIAYEYDLGDGWLHEIELQERLPGAGDVGARCTDGALACPPEDCGGPPGYAGLAPWVRSGFADSEVPEWGDPRELKEWLPSGWHPDTFVVDHVNRALRILD